MEEQVEGARIGIVAFAGFAEGRAAAHHGQGSALIEVIDSLTTARGTVIGAATLKALDAMPAVNPEVAPVGSDASTWRIPTAGAGAGYVPDIVVLLTDGANTRGVDPVTAAQEAARCGGCASTPSASAPGRRRRWCACPARSAPACSSEGGFQATGPGAVASPRRSSSSSTSPRCVPLPTSPEAPSGPRTPISCNVFASLPREIELQTEDREVSVAFAVVGALLVLGALGLSLLWNRST